MPYHFTIAAQLFRCGHRTEETSQQRDCARRGRTLYTRASGKLERSATSSQWCQRKTTRTTLNKICLDQLVYVNISIQMTCNVIASFFLFQNPSCCMKAEHMSNQTFRFYKSFFKKLNTRKIRKSTTTAPQVKVAWVQEVFLPNPWRINFPNFKFWIFKKSASIYLCIYFIIFISIYLKFTVLYATDDLTSQWYCCNIHHVKIV